MTIWGSRRFAFVLCVFQTNGTHTWAAQMCVQIQTFGFSWVHQSTLSNLFRIVFCHITSCDCRGIKQKKHPVLTKLRDPKKTHWKSPNSHLRLNRVPEKMKIHPRCHNQANLTCNSLGGLGLRMPGQKGCGFVLANPLQRLFVLKSNQPYSANPFNCNQHSFFLQVGLSRNPSPHPQVFSRQIVRLSCWLHCKHFRFSWRKRNWYHFSKADLLSCFLMAPWQATKNMFTVWFPLLQFPYIKVFN